MNPAQIARFSGIAEVFREGQVRCLRRFSPDTQAARFPERRPPGRLETDEQSGWPPQSAKGAKKLTHFSHLLHRLHRDNPNLDVDELEAAIAQGQIPVSDGWIFHDGKGQD